jgi:hypothetical protein
MLDLSLCEVAVLFCGKEGSEAPRYVQYFRPPTHTLADAASCLILFVTSVVQGWGGVRGVA